MSANIETSPEVTVAALAAVWRVVTTRIYRPDAAEQECAVDCDAADTLAWWMALTPAATVGEIAAKLRVYAHETRPGASAVGDALLDSIISDAARLSGDAEVEADPEAGQRLLDRLQFPIWRLEAAAAVRCEA
ncbi:MAG: hypothetical protein J0I21_01365 [Alphaproteobacteria bacterium]|nr:hypothetical protein [Alphaproteobacteria bacterium]